jgi:hypothetical protein
MKVSDRGGQLFHRGRPRFCCERAADALGFRGAQIDRARIDRARIW